MKIISSGKYKIVITHGNGHQVGNLLLACEVVRHIIPQMPLDVCGAATQGMKGYMLQQTLANHLRAAKTFVAALRNNLILSADGGKEENGKKNCYRPGG